MDVPDDILGIQFSPENTYILLHTIQNIHYALTVSDPQTNLNEIWTANIPTILFIISDHVSTEHLTAFRLRLNVIEALVYIHHHIQTMPTPLTVIELFPSHDFVHCSKCWRLVPRISENQNIENRKHHKKLLAVYCDEHSPIKI